MVILPSGMAYSTRSWGKLQGDVAGPQSPGIGSRRAANSNHLLPLWERVVPSEARNRVRGYAASERAKPLTRLAHFVRSPPSPTRGEGVRVRGCDDLIREKAYYGNAAAWVGLASVVSPGSRAARRVPIST